MTRRRWLLTHWMLVPPVAVLLIADLMARDWLGAITMATFIGLLVIHERADRWSFRTGWWIGVTNVGEALHRSESGEEFVRMIEAGPPEPWS